MTGQQAYNEFAYNPGLNPAMLLARVRLPVTTRRLRHSQAGKVRVQQMVYGYADSSPQFKFGAAQITAIGGTIYQDE